MKMTWLVFGVFCIMAFVIAYIKMPETIFSHMDAYGNATRPASRNATLGLIALLQCAVNFLLYLVIRTNENSIFFGALNIPNKKFWMSSPENRKRLRVKLSNVISATGAFVNFLVFTSLYMMIHYYHPSLPCPHHIIMLLTWTALSIALIIYTFQEFKKTDEPALP
jgi:hypothetical protein